MMGLEVFHENVSGTFMCNYYKIKKFSTNRLLSFCVDKFQKVDLYNW